MVPSGIKIGKEQLNVLSYADDIVLIGKNETEIRQLLVEIENIARKLGLHINQRKTKYMIVEWKNSLKNTFQRVQNFEDLGVILNEDNNHQINLQERIKNANKTYLCYKNF